jgi:hypothetical protein
MRRVAWRLRAERGARGNGGWTLLRLVHRARVRGGVRRGGEKPAPAKPLAARLSRGTQGLFEKKLHATGDVQGWCAGLAVCVRELDRRARGCWAEIVSCLAAW